MHNSQADAYTYTEHNILYTNEMPYYKVVKRIVDIIISFFGLIILCPVFIAISVLIKIDSKGPVFFKQERAGRNGVFFTMFKFRTMVANAEQLFDSLESKNELQGHMFKIRKDSRVTEIGRLLRKTSLDELPQLFNVLIGQMSLVGPRPPIAREVAKYEAWHAIRLTVKPGMTGLWQISGRNSVGFDEMVRLDIKYIRECSMLYDLKILLKTIPLLSGDDNAF